VALGAGLVGLLSLFALHTSASAVSLRGFGEITVTPLASGGLAGFQYQCDTEEHATVLLHKLGRDLSQTATVPATWQMVTLGGSSFRVLVRPGLGSFLPLAVGKTVTVFTTPATDNLGPALAGAAGATAGARGFDPEYRYPVYLDKFSHYGIGSWYPSYWGDNNTKDKPNSVDDHFAYAKKLDLALQPNGGGFLLRNLEPKLHEYGRPYHFADWLEWDQKIAILAPEELTDPGPNFTAYPSYYGQIGFGGSKLLTYRNWQFQQTVKRYVNDPLLVDWLDPNGEVGPWDQHLMWDFSENNRAHFAEYLQQKRGYTLATLGEAWQGKQGAYRSWKDVPIPFQPDLFGFAKDSIQADHTWRVHAGTLDEGLAAGYDRARCDDAGWPSFKMPGGETPALIWRANHAFWYRGTLQAPASWLKTKAAAGRIYLNIAALSSNMGWKNPDRVWVNGQEMASLSGPPGYSTTGQVDVTDVIRPGVNNIVYFPANMWGGPYGPFFLTDKPWEDFPYRDSHLNARFSDWWSYVSWCIGDHMEQTFKAIRAVDPNRFIKMHAEEDKQIGVPLQARYGGYGHNTGEGGFYRPWDKRFAYSRGVPASAEFGGGLETVVGLRRWIGWYTFEGTNAFDNFHNIQQMMYGPPAQTWIDYMPYLKLAPRRDLKKPDVALLWSSQNNRLLPRPVPYCFDIGRGDLQSIGYSYVDIDEVGLQDGLAEKYPVLWDTGTWIMSPATVARIKQYVENGGTFVALQETGRHSFTQRDAWPISDLTGWKVREVRPMTGTLSILKDQPLFTKLAGKNFYNRGKSIDYSDYNYANLCLALEPTARDTEVIARYEDGATAIGMRRLGKGRVILLGSPFWRDSYDGGGMWWPGEGQCQFLEDILAGIGLKPLAASDSHDIWREHYLANNGTEEFLCLWNPFDTERTFSIDWTTTHPATGLYDPKNGQPIAGTVNGNQVHLDKVTLPPLETLIVATQPQQQPQAAVQYWFDHLTWWWRMSEPGEMLTRPDLPLYEVRLSEELSGKAVTAAELATMDLAKLSQGGDPGAGFVAGAGQSPEALRSQPDANRRWVFRVQVDTPATWKQGDAYLLNIMNNAYGDTGSPWPVDAWLNGQQVMKGVKDAAVGYSELDGGALADIGAALNYGGKNTLVFAVGPQGFMGEVNLDRRPAPVETLDITGPWQVQETETSGLKPQELPGTIKGLLATKDVVIPAAWKGSRVFYDLTGIENYNSFAINDKVILLPANWYAPVTYFDITPWVKFGQPNRLLLLPREASRTWTPSEMKVPKLQLQRVNLAK
jgi:hypothetical protein